MTDDFNFDDAFEAVQGKVEAERAQKDAAREAAQRADAERFERAKASILADVVPVLEKARASFEARGVGASIAHSTAYSMRQGGDTLKVYEASFRCFDPAGDAVRMSASGTVKFKHDGSRVTAECSWEGRYAGGLTGEPPAIVVEGAKRALDYYLRSAAKLQ